ncbi:MAG: 2-dehydropantoate 2-reductase [Pseudomonadota bacterium]
MKICIVGAGSIGGFIGARLARSGQASVSAVARGDTLAALRQHGWRLREQGALLQVPAFAVENPTELGVQDVVVVAVKAQAMGQVGASIGPLLGPHTIVLPAMNGVPWWFAHGIAALGQAPLENLDPGARIAAAIPFEQVVGCVVHASTWRSEPGLVEHRMGQGLIIGDAGGGVSVAAERLGQVLLAAGFELTLSTNIRQDIWYKLWGNMTMNPVSAITGATIDMVLDDPLVRSFCSAAMAEASAVGALIGCAISQTPDQRQDITRKLGRFKTSMLQDVEAGRPIELDALVTVVHEMALRLGVATPNIDALLGLTRLFGRVHGLYE